eukprot:CAMPEP_0183742818 /NCGR_PEP_ID=MMETSP0737-20130205/64894_1 /TAXON_ID=385413 /ORGANISM="Thalassiosira miniscula, Strain CCMP1093" /LENGTH=2014 /DNA_ID=CAMNT_0025978411 /DNA_START=21 /DNA_END=6066 /DNA_ORIENTATION=+
MDPLFQSLLLRQSSADVNNAAADAGSGKPGSGSSGGTDVAGGVGLHQPRKQRPRPSRYAQLLPREAWRPPRSEELPTNKKKLTMKGSSSEGMLELDGEDGDLLDGDGIGGGSSGKGSRSKKKDEGFFFGGDAGVDDGEDGDLLDGDGIGGGSSGKGSRSKKKKKKKKGKKKKQRNSRDEEGGDNEDEEEDEDELAMNAKQPNGGKDDDGDSNGPTKDEGAENVRVYKMDGATGQLELLPEEEYDLVYHDENSDDDDDDEDEEEEDGVDRKDGKDDADGKKDSDEGDEETATSDTKGGEASDKSETTKTDETMMDVDKEEEEEKKEEHNDDNDPRDNDNTIEDAIYIVKGGPSPFFSLLRNPSDRRGELHHDASSTSSSSDSEDRTMLFDDNEPPLSTARPADPSAKEAAAAAATLARALVSRTDGFDALRPKYGLLENEDENETETAAGEKKKKEADEKKKKKEKRKDKLKSSSGAGGGGASATSSASAKGKEDLRPPGKGKQSSSGEDDADGNREYDAEDADDAGPSAVSAALLRSKKLLSALPPHADVVDGDTPATLLQLSRMRKWQEGRIEPRMQAMELDDWEDGIDWDGGCSSEEEGGADDDTNNNHNTQEKEGTAAAGEKGGPIVEAMDENDATPDFRPFRPPAPKGGRAKRPRRSAPHYDDPIELLLEPRNPRLEALDLSTAVDWNGAASSSSSDDDDYYDYYDSDNSNGGYASRGASSSRSTHRSDAPVIVPLILQSTVAGASVASLLVPLPTSRPPPFESHPNYQRRYDREMSSEITSTAELSKPGSSATELEKYKEARQRKREQMAKDKQSRVTEVMSALSLTGTGRRITSSLMGPGGAERTGRPSRHALGGSSSAHDAEYVEQLELVYNHTLVKPDLSLSEYRQFHRPRLPLVVVNTSCPWQFQTRVITEKKRGSRGAAKSGATAADGSTIVGSYHAMMSSGSKAQNKIRNEADLSPTIGDLVVVEYSEERPPLFMTKGMTCRIVNYYRGDRSRCPISAGGGDRPLRKRHGDKAAQQSATDAGAGPKVEERPPRLLGPNQYGAIKSAADLIGITSMKKKRKSKAAALEAKKAKENAIDVLPEGVTEILHQKVHGPFIGEVEEGKTQTGLISNLFAAPLFRHESEPTDFLMILGQLNKPSPTGSSSMSSLASSSSSGGGLGVVLRPLPPNIYCVGQTEPRVKVFAPNTNDEKKFVNTFVPYQVAKNIARTEEVVGRGLTFDDIKDRLFANTTIPHGQLRIRIKQVANFERSNNGIWSLKALDEDDFPGVEALGRKVSPEGVAAYESQCAAIRRLQDLGIKELYSGGNTVTNVASVMIFLNGAVQAAMERRLKVKKVMEMKKRQKSPQLVYFEKAFEKLDEEYKEVKRRQEVAKFVYEELQLSPWNISGEFIDVHKRAVGGAMMKLTGIGDPSGVGEAYNFLREADSRSKNAASQANNDGALNAQIKKITGTQNDLRKLTMKQMASLLRSYGMKDKQIAVLKRWDRVHVIRDLSTKAASDGMGDEMERFARGEKLRLQDQRQNYKERIQEIWRRQITALTADAGNNDLAARPDLAIGSGTAKDNNDVSGEGSDAGKDKDDDANDSDSSEDDDFADMMEMEMLNTGEANRLMTAQLQENDGDTPMRSIGALDTQELSKDAREFAALQRQREEERAMQEGDHKGSALGMGDRPKKKFKVVRRKITKTRPDGTQIVVFEIITNRDKVEEIIAKKKQTDEKKRNEKKKKKKFGEVTDADKDKTCVGHATFEDEDNAKARRSVKVRIKKETRLIHRKAPGPKKASHSKLTSTKKHSRAQALENRKKKRMKQQEEADLYNRGKGTSNRKERGSARERMPHVILSDRLESVRTSVEKRAKAGPFLKPVSRSLYPQYYEIIHEPIDLQTIGGKNRKYEYNTADKFVADFELMKKNAIKFNGKGSPLANEAVEIWEFVKSTVEENRQEFDQMEEAVRDQMSGKKKKKKAKSSKATSSEAETMNTANVVLDGIATQVNLGANFSFKLDEDSDSDDS